MDFFGEYSLVPCPSDALSDSTALVETRAGGTGGGMMFAGAQKLGVGGASLARRLKSECFMNYYSVPFHTVAAVAQW